MGTSVAALAQGDSREHSGACEKPGRQVQRVAVGTYSSMFTASPLAIELQARGEGQSPPLVRKNEQPQLTAREDA